MSNRDPVCCFKEWMSLQEQDLCELLQALNLDADRGDDSPDDGQLRQLIAKSIEHFEEYMNERFRLAREYHVSTFFVPGWCTLLECSVLWIAGCRPSIFIRLLYALIGEDFESQLDEYIQGRKTGTLGAVSPIQMNSINSLQAKTIREEDKLSTRLASLQEYVADDPIAIIARQSRTYHGEPCKEIREALDEHAKSMLSVMGDADILRLTTLKELISILTPVQAANFLAAGKKLHLCLHEWSKATENLNGTNIAISHPFLHSTEAATCPD